MFFFVSAPLRSGSSSVSAAQTAAKLKKVAQEQTKILKEKIVEIAACSSPDKDKQSRNKLLYIAGIKVFLENGEVNKDFSGFVGNAKKWEKKTQPMIGFSVAQYQRFVKTLPEYKVLAAKTKATNAKNAAIKDKKKKAAASGAAVAEAAQLMVVLSGSKFDADQEEKLLEEKKKKFDEGHAKEKERLARKRKASEELEVTKKKFKEQSDELKKQSDEIELTKKELKKQRDALNNM